MNLPAAVIAAMALCNQHTIATTPASFSFTSSSNGWTFGASPSCPTGQVYSHEIGVFQCKPETADERAKREAAERKLSDEMIAYSFKKGYAWDPGYQDKCKTISDYVADVQKKLDKKDADKEAADNAMKKAAEQPTLDKGIAALPMIGVQFR